MNTLPPEIIGRILELAVPPTTFKSFPERSQTLRTTSLVCRLWREESQRLLFGHAALILDFRKSSHTTDLARIFRMRGKWQSAKSLRVSMYGSDKMFIPPPSTPTKVSGSGPNRLGRDLTELALVSVTTAPDVLILCPCEPPIFPCLPQDTDELKLLPRRSVIRTLTIQNVNFLAPRVEKPWALTRLTDLSIFAMQSSLPLCLSIERLPSLRRLAHISSISAWTSDIIRTLLHLGDQINFICLDSRDKQFKHENFLPLAEKILFQVTDQQIEEGFDNEASLLAVRHVWVPYGEITEIERPHYNTWSLAKFDILANATFPNLQTLILPEAWLKSDGLDDFLLMLENRKLDIFYEDRDLHGYGDSHICEVFKIYQRGKRVAS